VAEKLRCPSCGGRRVDTRLIRVLRNGATFKRQMPLVRFLVWLPVLSVSAMASYKVAVVVLALAGSTGLLARRHNTRGIASSVARETHVCRECGHAWSHAPGEPEPAPFPSAPA
jgi:rubredoxin